MALFTYQSPLGTLPYVLDRQNGQVILTVPQKAVSKLMDAAQHTTSIRKPWKQKDGVGLTLKSSNGECSSFNTLADIALGELTQTLTARKSKRHSARTACDKRHKRLNGYCYRGHKGNRR